MLKNITDLVEKFSHNLDEYKNPKYNETSVRIEFVNPFWEALGWDVLNSNGYALAFRDVIHEDEVRVGHTTKAPDYSFRIGGKRIFFLETKKPSVDLKNDPAPAFQLRRYAYSAKLPVSLLTDFEEFIVYDTSLKPAITDKPHVGRMLYYSFEEYLENWEFIQSVFSKEAVKRGDFHRFIQDKQGKKPRAEIDRDFLNDLDNWRILLARNIALRNPDLSGRELNFAVQMTIDRLIFLRMCEDRGIEIQHTLQALLNGERVYSRLIEMYYRADERYNSGLFHFSAKDGANPDTITPTLAIDDKLLNDIIKKLYYPQCPYEFSVLPVEVLGNAYEQFLGKRISLTAGHHARIEEKPEVRKAGGVYYTPKYIVDYIVGNTVGKLLENQTPQQVGSLRILDPACGSGSFLLGAFQYLMDWHLNYYQKEFEKTGKVPHCLLVNGNRKSSVQAIFQGKGDNWFLSTLEKKRILLNNLYGVDIDANAVEVTKLSLLLKVLENENSETLTRQLGIWHERALPNLSQNIKCGNSLIGPDYYDSQQANLFDEEEARRINVFDWEKEFSEIFSRKDAEKASLTDAVGQAKGFDAVIGNPPYGAEFTTSMNNYFKGIYTTQVWRGESYLLFVEKSFRLLKVDGLFGYIIPDTYLNLGFTGALRTFLLKNSKLKEIVVLPSNVFQKATVDTTLLFAQKAPLADEYNKSIVNVKIFNKKASIIAIKQPEREFTIETDFWYEQDSFNVQSDADETGLLNKVNSNNPTIENIAEIFYGIKVYQVGKGKPPQTNKIREEKPFTSKHQLDNSWLPFYVGKHIGRYNLLWKKNDWLKYGQWLAEPRKPEKYESEKILIRKIVGKTLIATYVPETSYCNTLLFVLKIQDDRFYYRYVLGILNSRLIGWYFRKKFQISELDTFPQIMIRDILQIPIPLPGAKNRDRMVSLVEQMLDFHKKLSSIREPRSREQLQRRIESTDKQIDRLVYELYELTDEEIKVVEGS
ncbi:N-6 DNA methylase [bacterium]|nr:N-6 DNA methylase [bacterium]MBU1063993.1 N-6 DNA methylase [bacterium]MBU1636000.1 N-6 DNA methylase [bacterium]MBU1874735.1 N-6 DNA methylase [bacterium]